MKLRIICTQWVFEILYFPLHFFPCMFKEVLGLLDTNTNRMTYNYYVILFVFVPSGPNYDVERLNKNMDIDGNKARLPQGYLYSECEDAYALPTITDHCRISGISIQ